MTHPDDHLPGARLARIRQVLESGAAIDVDDGIWLVNMLYRMGAVTEEANRIITALADRLDQHEQQSVN